jgi:hypothetical protein
MRTNPTIPTANAPPWSNAKTPTPTKNAHSAVTAVAQAA